VADRLAFGRNDESFWDVIAWQKCEQKTAGSKGK